MTGDRMLDRLIAHLRTHVAEVQRLEQEGAGPHELAELRLCWLRSFLGKSCSRVRVAG
jgi:hypothetical protein